MHARFVTRTVLAAAVVAGAFGSGPVLPHLSAAQFGGGFRGRGAAGTATPGPAVSPGDVTPVADDVPFHDPATLRTLFLTFEDDDWEAELMAFHGTDVEVPAALLVDGRAYEDVGVHVRGASSFGMVPAGFKHSLNLSLDFVHGKQDVDGFRTLNLLNGHEDPTLLRAALYLRVARHYVPAARANFVRVVINGESWGIYTNVEQVNKDFIETWFDTGQGSRWKAPGSPNGRAGLEYLGDDVEAYRRIFDIKTKDTPEAWEALVNLTRVLNETPLDQLEAALQPILDVDETLKFLALDNVLANDDGYWTRASDYNLYLDPDGRFHVLPHDTNETFATGGARGAVGPPGGFGPPPGAPGGPSGGGGRRGGGRRGGMMGGGSPSLDLLVGLDDPHQAAPLPTPRRAGTP